MRHMYVDTETIGLTGPPVLIQTGTSQDDIQLYHVWDHPVQETLDFIEYLLTQVVVIYNASFDSFQLNKLYNLFSLVKDKTQSPDPQEVFDIDQKFDYSKALCLRPQRCVDLLMVLRKTIFQSLINKKPFCIYRVPSAAAPALKEHLEAFASQEVHPLLFAKFKNKQQGSYWDVTPVKGQDGFVNFKLSFGLSLKLKDVCAYLFNMRTVELGIPSAHLPIEKEYFPTNKDWLRHLPFHRAWWKGEQGEVYAKQDIILLDKLVEFLYEKQLERYILELDIDSELAWHVGAVKFSGFPIDRQGLGELIVKINQQKDTKKYHSQAALKWLHEVLEPLERLAVTNSAKTTLEKLIQVKPADSEVSKRAKTILNQRKLKLQLNLLEKLYAVGRFHPDFMVVGTATNRMSGRGGINPQGIDRRREVRRLFTLADPGETASGGDFAGQEVTVIDAIWGDLKLREALQSGKKVGRIFAQYLYAEFDKIAKRIIKIKDYDQVTDEEYNRAKNSFFAWAYGAFYERIAQTANCSIEQAEQAVLLFCSDFAEIGKQRARLAKSVCSMVQPNGIGTRIIWHEPIDKLTSIFGFSRSFEVENDWCRFLFMTANNLPDEIKNNKDKVQRKREKEQTVSGATQSAIYAAAFAQQASNFRQGANGIVQSAGAEVTKRLQFNIYDQVQPKGVAEWNAKTMNIHDEVLTASRQPVTVAAITNSTIKTLAEKIPLVKIDWREKIESWDYK